MNYRIEELEAFGIVGFSLTTSNNDSKARKEIPKFWKKVIKEKKQIEVLKRMDHEPYGLLGVCIYNQNPNDDCEFDYCIASSSSKEVPSDMNAYEVAAFTWAIFPCKSKRDVSKVEIKIVLEWQPTSDYNLVNKGYESGHMDAPAPDIVVYNEDGTAEVWIAVTKK